MKREFKKVEIDGSIHLYPIPVIKDKKYLIECRSDEEASKLMGLIEQNLIPHPDADLSGFQLKGHHTDGRTPIYRQLREN